MFFDFAVVGLSAEPLESAVAVGCGGFVSLCGGGDVGPRLFGGLHQLFTFASAFLVQTRLRQTMRRLPGSCELTISATMSGTS